MRTFFLLLWVVLGGISLFPHVVDAQENRPEPTTFFDSSTFGVSRQPHLFDDPGSSNSVILYGFVPLIGAGDIALLTGNIYALVTGYKRRAWGIAGILMSAISFALVPFFAAEGLGWAMIPLIPSATLLVLSIINVILGPAKKCGVPMPKPSAKRSFTVAPWFQQQKDKSLQGGLAVSGVF